MVQNNKQHVNKTQEKNSPEKRGYHHIPSEKQLSIANNLRAHLNPHNDIARDPLILRHLLTNRRIKILNMIMYYEEQCGSVYVSHETIADQVGMSRRAVISALQYFHKLGIIGWVPRFWKTGVYYTSAFFDQPWVRRSLRNIVRSTLTVAIGILFSIRGNNPNFTPGNNIGYIYNSQVVDTRRRTKAEEHEMQNRVKELSISHTVQELARRGYGNPCRGISLTLKGMVKLDVFPPDVIRRVYREFLRDRYVIHDPYRWFYKRCLEYCDRENRQIDWAWMYEMLHAAGFDNTDVGVTDPDAPQIQALTSRPSSLEEVADNVNTETEFGKFLQQYVQHLHPSEGSSGEGRRMD